MSVLTGGIIARNITDPIGFGASLRPDGSLASITGPSITISAVLPEGAVTANVGSLCIVADPAGASVWLKSTGSGATGWVQFPTSAGSGKGNLDVIQAYFDFTSAADITVGNIAVGDTVEDIKVEIFNAFNGANPSLTVGNPADHSAYLTTLGIPEASVITPSTGSVLAGAVTTAHLYLTLGGSTAGSGRVAISIRRV